MNWSFANYRCGTARFAPRSGASVTTQNVRRNARNPEIPERNTEVVASYGIVGSGFLLPEKDNGITKRSIRTRQTATRRLANALGNIQKKEMQGQKGG
jgi:hypothetical protein